MRRTASLFNAPLLLLCGQLLCSHVLVAPPAMAEAAATKLSAKQEFAVGNLYFDTDNFPLAIEHFTKAIKQEPTNGQYYYERGHAYYRLDQYIQANPDYTRSISLKFNPSWNYERRAFCYLNSNQLKKGIEDCTLAIKADPRSRIAYFNRWKAYVLIGEHEKSKADKEKLTELDKHPRPKDLCDRAQNTRNTKEKIDLCNAALGIDPKCQQALLILAGAYLDIGKKKEALENLNKLIALDPSNLTAYADRGLCRLQFAGYPDGIKDLNHVLEQAPDCYQAYYWRAECLRMSGQAKKSLEDYAKSVQLIEAGMKSEYAGKSDQYRNSLGRFLVSNYRGSAHAYEKMGNTNKAIEDITYAINGSRMAPHDLVQLLPERAQLFKKAGRDEEMHKDLLHMKAVQDQIDGVRRPVVIPPPPVRPAAVDKAAKPGQPGQQPAKGAPTPNPTPNPTPSQTPQNVPKGAVPD